MMQPYIDIMIKATCKTNHEQISNIIKGDSQFRKRFLVNKGDELSILNTDDTNYIMVDQKNILPILMREVLIN